MTEIDFRRPRNLTFSFSEVFVLSEIENCASKIKEKEDVERIWEEYWTKYGYDIALETWNILYGDYILDEGYIATDTKDNQSAEGDSLDYSDNWEALWTNHWTQQQNYVYSLFEENYYAKFDPLLVELTLEDEFIKKLGLPTSFSGSHFFLFF